MYCSTESVTDPDADMCSCLRAKWRTILSMYESVASAAHSGFERKAKAPIRVDEEDRQLQLRLCDVLSSVGDGMRGPQGLRHHGTGTHDPTVKYPGVLVGKLRLDVRRNRSDDEGIAISTGGGDGIALQETLEVSLGLPGVAPLGYIAIHENLLVAKSEQGTVLNVNSLTEIYGGFIALQ